MFTKRPNHTVLFVSTGDETTIILKIKDENAELRADVKYLMEQNSVMVENMERKSTDGNNGQSAETSLATTTQRILTPEMSSLITSVNKLAMKLERESGNNIGMDKSLEFRNFIFYLNELIVKWTFKDESSPISESQGLNMSVTVRGQLI